MSLNKPQSVVSIIPRVHLSPKVKQRMAPKSPTVRRKPIEPIVDTNVNTSVLTNTQTNTNPVKKSYLSPSRYKNNNFLLNKEKFRSDPSINPITGRAIKQGSYTYRRLVELYGTPY